MSAVRSFTQLRGWSSLRHHRNFRLFWLGQLISLIGTWMQTLGQAWLILNLTGNPFYLGLVAAAQFTPILVLGLFGGMIADLFPKRRTIIATQSAAMVLAFILAALVATGVVQTWHIFALALALGLVNAVDMPVRQSFVVEMVGREDVANAVALNSAVFNGARIVGPAVAGVLIGIVGLAACFFLNGVSFIAVIVGLWAMRDEELVAVARPAMPRTVRAVGGNLAEGIVYVRRTRIVLLAVWVIGVVSTAGMNFNVLMPALAKEVLGVGATELGFLMAAMGVGSLVAALFVAFLRSPQVRILVGGGIMLGVLEVVLGGTKNMPLAVVVSFGIGMGAIAMAASANSLIQLNVPDELRGRVMSVYTTVFAGSTPIGGIVAGFLAAAYGPPAALAVGGAVSAAAALAGAAWVWRWPQRTAAGSYVTKPAEPAG